MTRSPRTKPWINTPRRQPWLRRRGPQIVEWLLGLFVVAICLGTAYFVYRLIMESAK